MDDMIWDAIKVMGGFALAVISAILVHIRGQKKTKSDADVSLQDITTREAGRLVMDLREQLDRTEARLDKVEGDRADSRRELREARSEFEAMIKDERDQCAEKIWAMEERIGELERQVGDISEPM